MRRHCRPHVGLAVARDLLLSARAFDAAEAQRLGVISRVVPHEDLRAAAVAAAQQVLRTAPEARAHVKRMLNERYALIDYRTMSGALEHSSEPREEMRAFVEKRAAELAPARTGAVIPQSGYPGRRPAACGLDVNGCAVWAYISLSNGL